MFGIHLLICSIGVLHLGVLFLLSIILKLKKRSPAILLGLTVLFPLKALAFLGFVNAIFFVFIGNPQEAPHAKLKKHSAHHERFFLSNEARVNEGHREGLGFRKILSPTEKKSASAEGSVDELFKQISEERREEIKQMQEEYAHAAAKRRQEHASREVDFGKHCVLLGKIGEHVETSEAVTTPLAETSEQLTELNIPLFFGWDKAPYDTVQANSDE